MVRLLDLLYPGEERYRAFFPDSLLAELKSLVDYHDFPTSRSKSAVALGVPAHPTYESELYNAEILLTGWGSPPLPVDLSARGKLKLIVNVTGEVRQVVPKELLEQGVLLTNWGNSISRTVAESALMMILGCLRRIKPTQDEFHLRHGWRPADCPLPDSLFERSVGLFGFGAIAQDLVRLLQPFKVNLSAYSPHVPAELMAEMGVKKEDDLHSLFSTCDIISIHAARTAANMNAVNHELLSLLPDNGVLINTARGSVLNEADLAAQLHAGRLWAGLDVFANEPLPADSPLRGCDRVLLFPHQGGPTMDRFVDAAKLAVENIRHYLTGEPLVSTITARQYDLLT